MAETAVVDASPLILLARADLAFILRLAAKRVLVPRPVAEEILHRGPDDPTVRTLHREAWIELVEPPPLPEVILGWNLGRGESSVLAWAAANPGSTAIVDDLAARRCAMALEVPIRGTLGLVLVARRQGAIPAARPVVEQLRRAGMYLTDQVVAKALELVGER